jgi:thioredoxin reductase
MARVNGVHPPGRYPVVVVGSGPGGLQTSYFLGRLGIRHALISEDELPGGMFRRFPIYQRLISWSKPFAPVERATREYERFDWNSLLGDEPEHRAVMPEVMDGSSYFPARAEMETGIATFVDRTGLKVRYGCRWESTRRDDDGFVLGTNDGEYSCDVLVLAVGMAQPWKPTVAGIEQIPHYVDVKEPSAYAGRRVLLIGKRNSGFELADGLLPWVRQVVLVSPSPARISVVTRSLMGARARYLQPYEDHVLGGGNSIVDATIERIERTEDAFRVHARGTTVPGEYVLEADDAIAVTGFQVPMQDLRSLGVSTIMQDRLPAQTPFWESVSVPGLYFAGTVSQGATELKKYGISSSSAAVHGFRYNARVMVRHIAAEHLGIEPLSSPVDPAGLVDLLLDEASNAPELWHQKSYLARVVEFRDDGLTDVGLAPLAEFVDSSGTDSVAVTVESDADGDIRPALYVRRKGQVTEHILSSAYMHDFRTPDNRALAMDRLAPWLG